MARRSVGSAIYLDDRTGEPEWVTVKTGTVRCLAVIRAPEGADVVGNDIEVDYDKDIIKDAPRVDADGDLTPEEEQRLYDHYGLTRASGVPGPRLHRRRCRLRPGPRHCRL